MVRLRALEDRVRSSLFFVPMLFVAVGAVLGQGALTLDARTPALPNVLTATVDSARAVLQVVAGATISFAGIAFSVSLLLISMASSQYSPRVVHGLFRDPFNKRVMGVVVGTFTYCLMVLRAVRGPLDEGTDPVVPSISIILAVVLGVVTILAVVSFISHSAHNMDVSMILHRVTEEALAEIRRTWPDTERPEERESPVAGLDDAHPIAFSGHGWVQQVDVDALQEALEPGATMRLETAAGRYAIDGTPLCRIDPPPADVDETSRRVHAALRLGPTRTTQDDVTYGVRQLADVALKALSPGINDPTTAQDAMFHLGAVVGELLRRHPQERRRTDEQGRTVLLPEGITHAGVVGMAFDEVRLAAGAQPTVLVYLLEILHLLGQALGDLADEETREALRRQADLVLQTPGLGDLPAEDHGWVVDAHAARFGTAVAPPGGPGGGDG